MFDSLRRFGTAALASLGLLAAMTTGVEAQVRRGFPTPPVLPPVIINPNPYIAPGLRLQQYAYNTRVLANAYSTIPPYMFGYNPYPSPIITPNAGIYPSYNPLLSTGYNPYVGNPYLTTSPGLYGGSSMLSTTPGVGSPAYDSSLSTVPSGGYGGSGYGYGGYGVPPAAAYVNSIADLTNASANYYVTIERAKLLQEEVTRSRLETRRRINEEIERERMRLPNPETIRVKDLETATNRARRDPPASEVLSGQSLNDLLRHLSSMQAKGYRGPSVPLDEIDLTQINVAPVNEGGNIGLVKNLKSGEKLPWPSLLQGAAYKEGREKLDARLPAAVEMLRKQNAVPDTDIRDMEENLRKMIETLNSSIGDLSPSQYITSKRFLNSIQDALTATKAPGAMNFFNGNWVPKGKNVAELINNMKGLKFAPASPGGEVAYKSLHLALVAYDANMTQVAASK